MKLPVERTKEHDELVDAHEQPLVEHLIELRARLLRTMNVPNDESLTECPSVRESEIKSKTVLTISADSVRDRPISL